MKRLDHLQDPSWWFTVIIVGIAASVIAGFVKDYLERRFGVFLLWSKARREEAKKKRQERIDAWSSDSSLVAITFLQALISLALAMLIILLISSLFGLFVFTMPYGLGFTFPIVVSMFVLAITFIVISWRMVSTLSHASECIIKCSQSQQLPLLKIWT